MRDIDKEINDMFDGMSRQNLIDDLRDAGFDVSEGEGKVIYTDEIAHEIPVIQSELSEYSNFNASFKVQKGKSNVKIAGITFIYAANDNGEDAA
ncbi:hypothetical protein [Sporolactobacillus nakayamae]|uniref:Uncharacterized protein n=1 Tax=Sporolactobacillus nakayamae TaxID=269670 RepID=A0A1I2W790_9BACL|nr:hypothetical protein [Sporolactobacillus nakayamae]SFG96509.1 hypothetical protein SAMN02982927_03408 [Sporolactobacillus nakayamae]